MSNKSLVLSVLAFGLAIFAVLLYFETGPAPVAGTDPGEPKTSEALIRPYSPILGPEDAPVTIIEFFDPACEACRAFYPVVKDILAQYPDDVRVVIRYTPFHGQSSEVAVKLMEAARMQGVYEEVMQAFMVYQDAWASRGPPNMEKIRSIAAGAGLDLDAAMTQIKSPDIIAIFNQDKADVETMGIQQTPTFFVNGKPLDPFGEAQFRKQVAAEVEAAKS